MRVRDTQFSYNKTIWQYSCQIKKIIKPQFQTFMKKYMPLIIITSHRDLP